MKTLHLVSWVEKKPVFKRHIMSLANEWLLLKMNNEYIRPLILKLFITVCEDGDQNRKIIQNFSSYAIEELFTQLRTIMQKIFISG